MKLALKKAKENLQKQEIPVGAVIVINKQVISCCNNLTIHKNDPTAHAEILAIRHACSLLETTMLNNCDMYVTLEPCAMCSQAISLSKIRRLYFGAYNKKYGSIENGARIFQFCHYVPEIYGGFLEKENIKLLKDFFIRLRNL
ncbi:nucleoside deaminase [Neoehrlichia mikurensis]|uniref:tRNA-specific adenosine deaminase n=1 Tax=Neoehrlichia mikurensis TaxID=89586 RepID=A0A9Q9C0W3_9RICK|nr:nucleoside deaminase [Neoehrlichia mikurensis]QXK91826.1 nucleoside deaminase [Neoehrlichia mikurensis]QXK93260.1 nucleoside deaminase [Neoehrlichia mikurensis]QXK93516.1 nucleoside deaminase [Neoehrlichia mikurensis]UTO55529.1 nucleoside deaminase [Neoehrlichia mikurensis]UTO56450.1 nucleoside deaminase [Neoehrlichia mikurensis]